MQVASSSTESVDRGHGSSVLTDSAADGSSLDYRKTFEQLSADDVDMPLADDLPPDGQNDEDDDLTKEGWEVRDEVIDDDEGVEGDDGIDERGLPGSSVSPFPIAKVCCCFIFVR
jgi:hypothetical protein